MSDRSAAERIAAEAIARGMSQRMSDSPNMPAIISEAALEAADAVRALFAAGWLVTPVEPDTAGLPDDAVITVCSECERASCWQGHFYCEDARSARTVDRSVAELRALGRENPTYWPGSQVRAR